MFGRVSKGSLKLEHETMFMMMQNNKSDTGPSKDDFEQPNLLKGWDFETCF